MTKPTPLADHEKKYIHIPKSVIGWALVLTVAGACLTLFQKVVDLLSSYMPPSSLSTKETSVVLYLYFMVLLGILFAVFIVYRLCNILKLIEDD